MEASDLFKAAARRGVPLRMLTGVSSRRHADGKRSILKIRRAAKRTSRRVVGVRSVKRDLSVLIFRCSLLDLSLVARTQSSLSDSNLPLIYHSEKWVQTGSTPPPPGVLWCTYWISWASDLSVGRVGVVSPLLFLSLVPSIEHLLTELSQVSCQHPSPWDSPHAGIAAYRRGYCIPRGSCRSDVKHFQGVNGDLTSQHVATTDRTFMRLGQNSSLKKAFGVISHYNMNHKSVMNGQVSKLNILVSVQRLFFQLCFCVWGQHFVKFLY